MGELLRVIHFFGVLGLVGATLAASQKTAKYFLLFWLIIIGCHIWFQGCVLSRLERQLTQEDITIVDPFLSLFNLQPTRDNRNDITFIASFIMVATSIVKVLQPL